MKRIVVTGASGQLGRRVVHELLKRVKPEEVAISVREPQKVKELEALQVRVRIGDYENEESLFHSFEGASKVLVVSNNNHGEKAIALNIRAFETAKKSGASRLLYTSHMGCSLQSEFAAMRVHAKGEEYLKNIGVPFTSLRHGFYAHSAFQMMGNPLQTGAIAVPADGAVSWTAHDDLAAADAILLTEKTIDGATPALTSSEAIDYSDIAEILSELSGKKIDRIVVPDEKWVETLVGHGMPKPLAEFLLGIFRASRNGEFKHVDPTLEKLIGRKPLTVRDLLIAQMK